MGPGRRRPPLPRALPADWESHRSLSRYVRNMVNLPQSGIFRALAPPITFLTVETVALIGYADAVAQGLLPTYMPQMPNFGLAPFELTAFALALLLGFRTNISYSRCVACAARAPMHALDDLETTYAGWVAIRGPEPRRAPVLAKARGHAPSRPPRCPLAACAGGHRLGRYGRTSSRARAAWAGCAWST